MKELVLIVCTALLMFSCKSTKKLIETDKGTSEKTIERTTIIRPGDTITIDIPNVRYKDTIISRTNYENRTVASVYYDKQGNQRFECLSAEMKQEFESIKETIKNDKENSTDIERSFNPQYFIYALVAFGLVICILFFMLIRIQSKAPETTARLVKEFLNNKNADN